MVVAAKSVLLKRPRMSTRYEMRWRRRAMLSVPSAVLSPGRRAVLGALATGVGGPEGLLSAQRGVGCSLGWAETGGDWRLDWPCAACCVSGVCVGSVPACPEPR